MKFRFLTRAQHTANRAENHRHDIRSIGVGGGATSAAGRGTQGMDHSRLYLPTGLATLYAALRAAGVMVLWSAFRSPPFEKRLRGAGFDIECLTVRARDAVRKGARHTVFRAVHPLS